MPRLIISGFEGRMGQALRSLAKENESFDDFEIVAGFDAEGGLSDGVPVFPAPTESAEDIPNADVLVDFSYYSFVPEVLNYAVKTNTPAVIATTALGEEELTLLREAAKNIPVFRSANMSLGINIMAKMAKLAAPTLENNFNIEIIEAHHNQKKDAPSGTAILLAEAINDSLANRKELIFGRHGKSDAPDISQIGIHAVRGGTIPGKHTIMFAGPDEVIEITHTAYSRKIFAVGALNAARFIIGKVPGLYTMEDLLA